MANNHGSHRYLLQPDQAHPSQGLAPKTYPNCRVTPLINASAYYAQLYEAIQRVGGHTDPLQNGNDFIYIAGFLVNLVYPGDPLTFHTPHGPVRLLDLLIEKARAGVDVRLLIWVSWTLGLVGKLEMRPENVDNLRSIRALRKEPALAKKVCINLLPHPAGSAHAKLVLVGSSSWAAGFTGGIDLSPDRSTPDWLDVQAKVEGPAIHGLLDFFIDLWNQNLTIVKNNRQKNPRKIGRPARFKTPQGWVECIPPGATPISPRRLDIPPAGEQIVQSLRTLPRFSFAPRSIFSLGNVLPLPSAPQGLFEVKAALQKAFSAAERYIYIEDQYFWCTEVMQWLNACLRNRPGLRLILVTGKSDQLEGRLVDYRVAGLVEGLFPGLSAEQKERIKLLQRDGMLHAKTALVDDRWAIIGSANLACRSLFTDIEHSIAVVDPAEQFVKEYRARLWGMHWQLSEMEILRITDLREGLKLWDRPLKDAEQEQVFSPFHSFLADLPAAHPSFNLEWKQMIEDPDSRQPWYFPLKAYMKVNRDRHLSGIPGYANLFNTVSTRG